MRGLCGPSVRFVQEMHGFVASRDENSGFCNGKWAPEGRPGPILPRVSSHFVQQFVLVGKQEQPVRGLFWIN